MESTSAATSTLYDRLTGEALPGPQAFSHTELGAFSAEGVFRRNVLAHTEADIARWRMRYNNTGLFRSVLGSNEPDFLTRYREPGTLFYGDLCFDCDISKKEDPDVRWQALVDEVVQQLIPALKGDFDLSDDQIRIWFSGGRGLHIEVPARALGVWPHHDLHRIFGFYAKDLKERQGLQFVDLSLYGGKHLYRLEQSIHQRSGLYKWPLKASELRTLKDFAFIQRVTAAPRPGALPWREGESSKRGQAVYTKLVQAALEVRPRTATNAVAPGDTSRYDRSNFLCISTLFSENFLLAEGTRNTTAFMLASHLRQNGFNYDQAAAEMRRWATEHCDPPFTSETDVMEWTRALDRVYQPETAPAAGCTFIQNTLPHLCDEARCKIGIARRARRQSS